MSYDVSFKAKLEGVEQFVYVGDKFINHTSNTANMMKEVCGSYPSEWDGKKCGDMREIIKAGADKLEADPESYRCFEPGNGWGTVESTQNFLRVIARNCEEYPTAVFVVSY